MPCDRTLKKGQTLSERKAEILKVVERVQQGLVSGRVKVVVGKFNGAIAFSGLTLEEMDGATDNCIYRRIMSSGSALAKAKIAQAEQIAGRSVDKLIVGNGTHSHDGGTTWHDHKG